MKRTSPFTTDGRYAYAVMNFIMCVMNLIMQVNLSTYMYSYIYVYKLYLKQYWLRLLNFLKNIPYCKNIILLIIRNTLIYSWLTYAR